MEQRAAVRRFGLAILLAVLSGVSCQRGAQPVATVSFAASDPHTDMSMPQSLDDWARGAQLYDRLGPVHRAVSTRSQDAQRYFDQGLSFMWGFNHDEATRSFARATQLDLHCAACYWAVALTVGPNYNLPFLTAERARMARNALLRAQRESAGATTVEQALIEALVTRYPDDKALDAQTAGPVLSAYAAAMRSVAARFPDDLDVQTLFAESMMNVHAWKLWSPQGAATEGTDEIVRTLEGVLRRDPQHIGANHYYIHVMEASPHPERALPSAERLRTLVPGAGHLVHMPAHIYQRLGRYGEAVEANRNAAREDQAYAARTRPLDYYPVMYTAHNYQFLAYSAAMAGRRVETLAAADQSRATVTDEMLLQMPGSDWYVAEVYLARVRFGLWDEVLSLPFPDRRLVGLSAAHLYARAMALAATGRSDDARAAATKLETFARTVPSDAGAGQNLLRDVLDVAMRMVAARIAESEQRPAQVIAQLQEAVRAEDRLAYDEPRNWFTPSRHALGAALLAQHRPREAEAVYRADLVQNPDNGWALFGLKTALEAQHRSQEAMRFAQAFTRVWTGADTPLAASVF